MKAKASVKHMKVNEHYSKRHGYTFYGNYRKKYIKDRTCRFAKHKNRIDMIEGWD